MNPAEVCSENCGKPRRSDHPRIPVSEAQKVGIRVFGVPPPDAGYPRGLISMIR
jgi:hypothetical protein